MPITERAEKGRLAEDGRRDKNWKRWGPYLAERQWGTVREDYSARRRVLGYFPHDHARSRAYRWGEDGLLGIYRSRMPAVLRPRALERARSDPEGAAVRAHRPEGNHGEDVKECYYLPGRDADALVHARRSTNIRRRSFPMRGWSTRIARRGRNEPEFELVDTGVFDENRYFDVSAEYAKAIAGRHFDPHHRRQSRARGGNAAPAADAVVSQHLVLGLHARGLSK